MGGMELREAAPLAGLAAAVATLGVVAAPQVVLDTPGTGLSIYYGSGPLGIGGVVFLAAILSIVFLSARHERRDPATIAGIAAVGGVTQAAFTAVWALSVRAEIVFSLPAAWMQHHRWLVLASSLAVCVAAVGYAWSVLE